MLATALAHQDGPIALRYPRGQGLGVPLTGDPRALPIGKGARLSTGDDVCLLAIGSMVAPASVAAERLARAGIAAEVVNMRFVKPLDTELLDDIWSRHRIVVTIEENSVVGGFGAGVLEWAAAHARASAVRVVNVGIPDAFQEHATRAELLADMGLSGEKLAARVIAELQRYERADRAQSAS
jgi:1-deoxy-D-xylulose-5-phosphate synthase